MPLPPVRPVPLHDSAPTIMQINQLSNCELTQGMEKNAIVKAIT